MNYTQTSGRVSRVKRIDPSHFLVVIYKVAEADRGLIKTAFIINQKRKNKRNKRVMTSRTTILDLDLRKILSKVEQRYEMKLPRSVLAVDYGEHGDLYVRFRHVEKPIGEPSKDGLAVFLRNYGNQRSQSTFLNSIGPLKE